MSDDPRNTLWHSRGYLPHFDATQTVQHVTFHLADSLAADAVERMERSLLRLPEDQRDLEKRKQLDAWIDAGHGACVLRQPQIAKMVQDALLCFDAQRYRLLAWVIMPNHVHVLLQPLPGWTLAKIVTSWKSFTGRKISAQCQWEGDRVWHREYWDRYMRDEAHSRRVIAYIQNNPVTAGLAVRCSDWPWGSAALLGDGLSR